MFYIIIILCLIVLVLCVEVYFLHKRCSSLESKFNPIVEKVHTLDSSPSAIISALQLALASAQKNLSFGEMASGLADDLCEKDKKTDN